MYLLRTGIQRRAVERSLIAFVFLSIQRSKVIENATVLFERCATLYEETFASMLSYALYFIWCMLTSKFNADDACINNSMSIHYLQ